MIFINCNLSDLSLELGANFELYCFMVNIEDVFSHGMRRHIDHNKSSYWVLVEKQRNEDLKG